MRKVVRAAPECAEVMPSPAHVLRRASCPKEAGSEMEARVERMMELLGKLARPGWAALDLDVEGREECALRTEALVLKSCMIADRLASSEMVTLILGTLGPDPERKCSELDAEGEHLDSMLLDAAASAMVEEVMRTAHTQSARRMEGMEGTARYAPGYGDFLLDHQVEILKALGDNEVQVSRDTYMLNPRKSSTAVVGWRHG
ncbi:hypothetical protein GF402_00055 [Candidatus Fermentibacteria bacterium]|nr:hypothetical protein [Candidatus Fermentibacteria bacterium]